MQERHCIPSLASSLLPGPGAQEQPSRLRSNAYLLIVALAVTIGSVSLSGCSVRVDTDKAGPLMSEVSCHNESSAFLPEVTPAADIDYDPWESFNQKTFWFNHDLLDRYALKPVATVWHDAVPRAMRQSLANGFDNLAMPDRLVNLVLQGRFRGAGRETLRFLLNTTIGVAGLFDVATRFGLEKNAADSGQTLAMYGAGVGPYLVLPFLPPMTVRDGIGYGVDSALDPFGYFIVPFIAHLGMTVGSSVNERADNLELYQDAEDVSIDLYAAVRNGYLQRRQKAVEDAIEDRDYPENDNRSFASCIKNRSEPRANIVPRTSALCIPRYRGGCYGILDGNLRRSHA